MNDELAGYVDTGSKVAKASLIAFLTSNIILNNIFMASISLMWGFINSL